VALCVTFCNIILQRYNGFFIPPNFFKKKCKKSAKNCKKVENNSFWGQKRAFLRLFLLHFAKWLNKKSPYFSAGA